LNLEQMLQIVQMGVSFLAFGGIVFGMGRMAERLNGVERSNGKTEIKLDGLKESLFGADGSDGVFLRRSEFREAIDTMIREREAQDRRMGEISHDIGGLRERIGRAS